LQFKSQQIEVGEPSADNPRRGLLEVSVDLSSLAGANQDNFATDRYSAELSQSLQLTLERCGMLDAPAMCIIPNQYCWTIFVDFVVLGVAGNLGDLLSLAAYCALCDAAIPETTVIETEQGMFNVDDLSMLPYVDFSLSTSHSMHFLNSNSANRCTKQTNRS
jgi:exosome complex RNA-binding protein Rrp42 (RNase PH superfamily)